MESLEDQVRTPQQVAADEKLLEAITECLIAYEMIEDGFVVGDFVVVNATNRLSSQGVIQTRHPLLFRDGDIPWYRIAGLIDMAKIEVSLALSAGNDNG